MTPTVTVTSGGERATVNYALIRPPAPDPVQEFLDTRCGPAQATVGGWGGETRRVTTLDDTGPGSLRTAVSAPGPAVVILDDTLTGDLAVLGHGAIRVGRDKTIVGSGWQGAVLGSLDLSNSSNTAIIDVTVAESFAYGHNPSGPAFGLSNGRGLYLSHCDAWNTGDVCIASGAYSLGASDQAAPYWYTVEACRIGPNPGPYSMQAPFKGATPGQLNGINNDPRNGKGGNNAVDHSDPAGTGAFAHQSYGAFIGCIFQGCIMRCPKCRSQYLDVIGCLIAKWGAPYNLGGPSIVYGGGVAVEDDGVMNVDGCVWVPYSVGESFLGSVDITVTDPGAAAVNTDGTAPKVGNMRLTGNNWLGDARIEPARYSTGFDRAALTAIPAYDLPVPDVTTYEGAAALVRRLDGAGNRTPGNRPPSWRSVHTGALFAA